MMQFDRMALGRQAKELGFVRDTFEKVCRLADILKFFEGDDMLSEYLALRGALLLTSRYWIYRDCLLILIWISRKTYHRRKCLR